MKITFSGSNEEIKELHEKLKSEGLLSKVSKPKPYSMNPAKMSKFWVETGVGMLTVGFSPERRG